jgi:hypothetical protein
MIASLNANVERYIRLLVSRSDYRLQAQREHRAILASARVRNAASLAALVEHHALETAVQLRQFLLLHQESELQGREEEGCSPNGVKGATAIEPVTASISTRVLDT